METAGRAEVAKVVALRDWVQAVAARAAARGMAWVAAARAAAAEAEADDSAERSEGSAVCVPKESDRKGAQKRRRMWRGSGGSVPDWGAQRMQWRRSYVMRAMHKRGNPRKLKSRTCMEMAA